jgi:hypothetical protein
MSMVRRVASMVLATALLGCTAPAPAPEPTLPWQPPADWVIVSTADGGLQLTLPPWLVVFDNHGAIFANEAPADPGGQIPVQLMALGIVEDQPLPGESLEAWLSRRLSDPGQGVPSATRVVLPAGPALRYERIDRAGAPTAWHILVFAIETPRGVAYLQLDGTLAGFAARAAELDRIAFTFRLR